MRSLQQLLILIISFAMTVTLSGQEVVNNRIQDILNEKLIARKLFKHGLGGSNDLRGSEEFKFTPNVNPSLMEGEPMIAVNPQDGDHVIVSFMAFSGGGLDMPTYITLDGGETWQVSSLDVNAVHDSDPMRSALNVLGGGDPMMVFAPDGTIYYSWIFLAANDFTDARWFNYILQSTDRGRTFDVIPGGSEILNTGGINLFTSEITRVGEGIFDRHWFGLDLSDGPGKGNLYMAGLFFGNATTQQSGPGVVVKTKKAGEADFGNNVLLSASANAQFSQVQVDAEGVVHVVYGDIDANKIVHHHSTDQGQTFSPAHVIGDMIFNSQGQRLVHDRENPAPSLSIDEKNDVLHVTWTITTNPPISMYAKSEDGGETWNFDNLQNWLPLEYDGAQLPSIATDDRGNTSVFLYAMKEKDGDYVHLLSRDAGETFIDFQVVSGAPTAFGDYSLNSPLQETFFGDYFASASGNCSGFGVYSDGRLGQGPKVYLSKVDVCEGTSTTTQYNFNDLRFIVPSFLAEGHSTWTFDAPATSKGSITVIDMQGRVLLDKQVDLVSGPNTGSLPLFGSTGVCTIQLHWQGQVFVRKSVIQP